MRPLYVFRYEDGVTATVFAEVAVRADDATRAIGLLAQRGMHVEQLWDRGRTPCPLAAPAATLPGDVPVSVRRHTVDGRTTPWVPVGGSLDRRRQVRSRAAASTAQ